MATPPDIVDAIKRLAFRDSSVLPEVLEAAAHTDLGPLVRSLAGDADEDVELLTSTLEHFADAQSKEKFDRGASAERRSASRSPPPAAATATTSLTTSVPVAAAAGASPTAAAAAAAGSPRVDAIGMKQLIQVQNLMSALLQRYKVLQADFDSLAQTCAHKDRTVVRLQARVKELEAAAASAAAAAATAPSSQQRSSTAAAHATTVTPSTSAQRPRREKSSSVSPQGASPSKSVAKELLFTKEPVPAPTAAAAAAAASPASTAPAAAGAVAATTPTPQPVQAASAERRESGGKGVRRMRKGETEARQRALLHSHGLLHGSPSWTAPLPHEWSFKHGTQKGGSGGGGGACSGQQHTPARGGSPAYDGPSPSPSVHPQPTSASARAHACQHALYPRLADKKPVTVTSVADHRKLSVTPPKALRERGVFSLAAPLQKQAADPRHK